MGWPAWINRPSTRAQGFSAKSPGCSSGLAVDLGIAAVVDGDDGVSLELGGKENRP